MEIQEQVHAQRKDNLHKVERAAQRAWIEKQTHQLDEIVSGCYQTGAYSKPGHHGTLSWKTARAPLRVTSQICNPSDNLTGGCKALIPASSRVDILQLPGPGVQEEGNQVHTNKKVSQLKEITKPWSIFFASTEIGQVALVFHLAWWREWPKKGWNMGKTVKWCEMCGTHWVEPVCDINPTWNNWFNVVCPKSDFSPLKDLPPFQVKLLKSWEQGTGTDPIQIQLDHPDPSSNEVFGIISNCQSPFCSRFFNLSANSSSFNARQWCYWLVGRC